MPFVFGQGYPPAAILTVDTLCSAHLVVNHQKPFPKTKPQRGNWGHGKGNTALSMPPDAGGAVFLSLDWTHDPRSRRPGRIN